MNAAVENLALRYDMVRSRTLALAEPLSEEDCCAQSMPDASPVKWHLAHTTWFFETFVLEQCEPEFQPFHPAFRILFNSYYNGVGEKHPRPQRGMLTRPSLADIRAYREHVDERMQRLLARGASDEVHRIVTLGLHHEQQHQELMLTDVKHLLSLNPLFPAYADVASEPQSEAIPMTWIPFEAGVVEIGCEGKDFCFDNETPRHREFLEDFCMASRLVTNGEFLAFVEDGGYRDPALWLSEGWDWIRANNIERPFYWHASDDGWKEFSLQGLHGLDMQRPAVHLSYYEADAFARWGEARLPTEAEWERAAYDTRLTQLFGVAWQWTSSSYAPYPGYAPASGAIGEYNGKFMVNQYVLRGSSSATPVGHERLTYRNFFPANARWQFAGIRLAKSPSPV